MLTGTIVAGVLALLVFGFALRAYRLPGALLCLLAFGSLVLCAFSAHRSTFPTSAERVTIEGRTAFWNPKYSHSRHWRTFFFQTATGKRLALETDVDMLEGAGGNFPVADGDWVRLTYLNETPIFGFPRAIGVEVLSGRGAGWKGTVDANWFGSWLGAPLGLLLAFVLWSIAARWKKDREEDAP
jgi:hypothetical protein